MGSPFLGDNIKSLSRRPLRTDEWELLRELRIRALTDAPDAFAQTIWEIQDEPEMYWQQLAKNLHLSHHEFFIAFLNEEPIGITYGHLEAADRQVAAAKALVSNSFIGQYPGPPLRGRSV